MKAHFLVWQQLRAFASPQHSYLCLSAIKAICGDPSNRLKYNTVRAAISKMVAEGWVEKIREGVWRWKSQTEIEHSIFGRKFRLGRRNTSGHRQYHISVDRLLTMTARKFRDWLTQITRAELQHKKARYRKFLLRALSVCSQNGFYETYSTYKYGSTFKTRWTAEDIKLRLEKLGNAKSADFSKLTEFESNRSDMAKYLTNSSTDFSKSIANLPITKVGNNSKAIKDVQATVKNGPVYSTTRSNKPITVKEFTGADQLGSGVSIMGDQVVTKFYECNHSLSVIAAESGLAKSTVSGYKNSDPDYLFSREDFIVLGDWDPVLASYFNKVVRETLPYELSGKAEKLCLWALQAKQKANPSGVNIQYKPLNGSVQDLHRSRFATVIQLPSLTTVRLDVPSGPNVVRFTKKKKVESPEMDLLPY